MFILLKSSLACGDLLFYLYLDIMLLQWLQNPVFEKINLNKSYTNCITLTTLQGHIYKLYFKVIGLILQSLQKDTNLQVLVEKLLKPTKCLLEHCIHPHSRRDDMMYCDPFCGVSSAYHITVGEEQSLGSDQAVDLLDLSLRSSDGVGARVCQGVTSVHTEVLPLLLTDYD